MTSAEDCLVRLRVKPTRIEDVGYEPRTGVGTNWDAGEELAPAIEMEVPWSTFVIARCPSEKHLNVAEISARSTKKVSLNQRQNTSPDGGSPS